MKDKKNKIIPINFVVGLQRKLNKIDKISKDKLSHALEMITNYALLEEGPVVETNLRELVHKYREIRKEYINQGKSTFFQDDKLAKETNYLDTIPIKPLGYLN